MNNVFAGNMITNILVNFFHKKQSYGGNEIWMEEK